MSEDAKRSIAGVLRFARRDPDALDAFDISLEGFWRSFNAAWILLPLSLVYWVAYQPETVGTGRVLVVESINYLLSWTLWPLIVFYIARAAGWEERYLAYITVYNWTQILTTGGLLAGALVIRTLLGGQAWAAIVFPLILLVLVFEAYIAKRTLQITWGQAAAVEAVLVVLAMLLESVRDFVLFAGVAPSD